MRSGWEGAAGGKKRVWFVNWVYGQLNTPTGLAIFHLGLDWYGSPCFNDRIKG